MWSSYEKLKAEFKVTTETADNFLGIEIELREDSSIKIHQEAYAQNILSRFGMADRTSVSTPTLKVSEVQESGKENKKKFAFREAVGALVYLMLGTRPDLTFSVGILSRTLEKPTDENITRLKRAFRYLKSTIHYGITYKSDIKVHQYGVLQ